MQIQELFAKREFEIVLEKHDVDPHMRLQQMIVDRDATIQQLADQVAALRKRFEASKLQKASLRNGWLTSGGASNAVCFFKGGGMTFLRGSARNADAMVDSTLFTLPYGYCPPDVVKFPSGVEQVVTIHPSGEVVSRQANCSLDGIMFWAEKLG